MHKPMEVEDGKQIPRNSESSIGSLTMLSSRSFWVEPPTLPLNVRRMYKEVLESSLANSVKLVDEIIGEYFDGGNLYYYARYDQGMARKFLSSLLRVSHPDAVRFYEHKKEEGTLAPFDPTANYVHPLDRVRVVLTIRKKRKTVNNTLSDDEDNLSEGDGYTQGGRKTRSSATINSSRRVRSGVVVDSEDEFLVVGRHFNRISVRQKRKSSQLSEEGSEETSGSSRQILKKMTTYRAPIKPEYGVIRSIEDLDCDSGSESEFPLKAHRDFCEKCRRQPTHILVDAYKRRLNSKRKKRKRLSQDESEESEDDLEKLSSLGGWVRCMKCPVSAHWQCLASAQRQEIARAYKSLYSSEGKEGTGVLITLSTLDARETTEFVCGACDKGGLCMNCMEIALQPSDGGDPSIPMSNFTFPSSQHLFRCLTCKRLSHYEHLPKPDSLDDDASIPLIATHYQEENKWLCHDCISFSHLLDKIIAWRPYPPNAKETFPLPDTPAPWKHSLPREYLVKWQDKGYRRVQWVPHMWLLSTNPAKLKNFLLVGTKVQLAAPLNDTGIDIDDPLTHLHSSPNRRKREREAASPLDAMFNAESRIPLAWKTIDRVLAIRLWRTSTKDENHLFRDDIISDDEYHSAFLSGEEPSPTKTEPISSFEARTGCEFTIKEAPRVIWALFKWDDLGYEEATWDAPPRMGEDGYEAYKKALEKFIISRKVFVPRLSKEEQRKVDSRREIEVENHLLRDVSELNLGQKQELKLMDFQLDGFNWLIKNWWTHQPCILADDMGLGKTVQIAAFLGYVNIEFKIAPMLVVVPNSTITNWVREFERWAPKLRVVPFYGESKARDLIRLHELHHENPGPGNTKAKFHVLITTYEAAINAKDFAPVFKNQPRWEILVVDEGQRLKNDSSLLFRKLNELNVIHRVIMTGTPLNNNIRELFNLMNFLDPNKWQDLEALEKEHEELTEELVKDLHLKLRPYFLRRVKAEVLKLPPKNEVIVPVSMTSLQKEVYKSILGRNLDILKNLAHSARSKAAATTSKAKVQNILMELRKCLQHPYLCDENIEPRDLTPKESHEKLIDGSTKLRFLRSLLPKLRERGHRVLLFSQFVIALDIIEDFLVGEGMKFLRLDGNTKGSDRQKFMDEYNQPNSDVFIFLLTTRAGGVGINLYTADTVIIFDPDFNPHQDLQAIARAYRYGQQNTCLVFKLMVKDSAEERIMQIGKKKLVLDHLIVQKINDGDTAGEDVQSILTYGANTLFEDSIDSSRDINYSDQDIQNLIEKTEVEGDEAVDNSNTNLGALSFSFAKVWSADKDSLDEVEDMDPNDSWAHTLQRITEERAKIQKSEVALAGRGTRRKAAVIAQSNIRRGDSRSVPDLRVRKGKGKATSESAYSGSAAPTEDEITDELMDIDDFPEKQKIRPLPMSKGLAAPRSDTTYEAPITRHNPCGLCGEVHANSSSFCPMTQNSQNLAEFREMLVLHAISEPWEERFAAIRAIEETLHKRGDIKFIAGQPLHLLQKAEQIPHRVAKSDTNDAPSSSRTGPSGIAPSHRRVTTHYEPIFDDSDFLQTSPWGLNLAPILPTDALAYFLKYQAG